MVYCKRIIFLILIIFIMINYSVYAVSIEPHSENSYDSGYYFFYNQQYQNQLNLINYIYTWNTQYPEYTKIALDRLWTCFKSISGETFLYVTTYSPPSTSYSYDFIVCLGELKSTTDIGDKNNIILSNFHDVQTDVEFNNIQVYQDLEVKQVLGLIRGASPDLDRHTYNGFNDFPIGGVGVLVPQWLDFFKDFGYITSENDNSDIVGDITDAIQSTQKDYSESLSNINEEQKKITQELENQTQQQHEDMQNMIESIDKNTETQQETQNWLTEEATDESISLDGFNDIGINDYTAASLDSLFTTFYNIFSNWTSKDIVIPIKDNSFSIPASLTEDALNKFDSTGTIVNLVSIIYYYIVSVFIFKYMTHLIKSFQTGAILNTDTSNDIKTDFL